MNDILFNIWSQFNSRERAIGCWIAIFLIFSIFKKDIRKSIFDVIFSKNAFQLLFPVITYNVLIVYFLYVYGFWNMSFFKDSLYWILGSSIVIFFHIADVDRGVKFLFKTIISSLSVTALVAFVGNIYPFSFWGEFILQAILVFLSIMSASGDYFASKIVGYSKVAKIFETVLLLLGIFLIVRIFFLTIYEYQKLFSVQNLYFFVYPLILSILYIPFLYCVRLLMNYESLFIHMSTKNSSRIKHFFTVKSKIFLFCGLSLYKLNRFSAFFRKKLYLENEDDIQRIIADFQKDLE